MAKSTSLLLLLPDIFDGKTTFSRCFKPTFLDDFLMVKQLNPKANVELRTQVEVVEPLAGSKITWDTWVPWIPCFFFVFLGWKK